ncbi:MAG: hypothetical protein ACYTFH_06485 [Planctomycetota bacterium]|jgi:hypothetical protein
MPTLPDRLSLRLALPGLPELEPLVRDFAGRALDVASFGGARREALLEAFISSVSLVEETLRREGDPIVDLEIEAVIDADALEFRLLEHGMPLGEGANGGEGDAEGEPRPGDDIAARVRPAEVFDRLWWVQKGAAGSELHLRIHRPHATIEVLEEVQHRLEESNEAEHTDLDASAQTGEYRIRGYRADDGLEIARRIYEAYGRTYANPDLYVPDRIERLNRDGRLHSIVCESPGGEIVGHYALERPDLGPTGEAGQAVIDHRHRGHGLMRPMREAVENAGRRLGLIGVWSQPTAMHPLSQRMNIKFGSVPCALQLGRMPSGTVFRGGVAGSSSDHAPGGRRSNFLYWHPLEEEPPLAAHAPDALVDLLTALYAARGREVEFNHGGVATHAPKGEPVHCRYSSESRSAWISADRIDAATTDAIRAAADAMEAAANAEAVFVDLPIDDPGTPAAADRLLNDGFSPCGIAPRVIPREDERRTEDALRLVRHTAPVDLPAVVAEGELGRRLAEFASGGAWDAPPAS